MSSLCGSSSGGAQRETYLSLVCSCRRVCACMSCTQGRGTRKLHWAGTFCGSERYHSSIAVLQGLYCFTSFQMKLWKGSPLLWQLLVTKKKPYTCYFRNLELLSSTVLQNKSINTYANKWGLGFFTLFLCFYAWIIPQNYIIPKETQISLRHLFSKVPEHVFCKRNMSLKLSVISCEISPLSDRADCCISYFLYTCRQKKWQLMATRTFSSVYWSPQFPPESLPERQFSWLQAVLINLPYLNKMQNGKLQSRKARKLHQRDFLGNLGKKLLFAAHPIDEQLFLRSWFLPL